MLCRDCGIDLYRWESGVCKLCRQYDAEGFARIIWLGGLAPAWSWRYGVTGL